MKRNVSIKMVMELQYVIDIISWGMINPDALYQNLNVRKHVFPFAFLEGFCVENMLSF